MKKFLLPDRESEDNEKKEARILISIVSNIKERIEK